MLTQAEFIQRFENAERLLQQEKIPQALGIFINLTKDRLRQMEAEPAKTFSLHDAILLERTADLGHLSGQTEGARTLLDALAGYYFEAGNEFAGVYTLIKIANLQLGEGHPAQAFGTLRQLESWTGDLTALDLSLAGLERWERSFPGQALFQKNREAALIFSRLQFVMGSILTALGQYGQAIACLERSIHHAGAFPEDVAVRSMLLSARTALARAFLQNGGLENARSQVEAIENAGPLGVVRKIHLLEIKGKLAMLQGRYGDALTAFTAVAADCRRLALPQPQVVAICNLAEIKMLVNQSFEAEELLAEAGRIAVRHGLANLQIQVRVQEHLAVTRSTSPLAAMNLFFPKKSNGGKSGRVANTAWQGLSEAPVEDDFLLAFEQRALVVQLWLGEGGVARARGVLDETKLIFENTDSGIIRHRLASLGLMVSYYEGAEVAGFFDEIQGAMKFFEARKMLPELWQLQRMILWTGLLPEPEAQHLASENQRLLDTLTQSLPPEAQTIFLLNKWTADEEYLASRLIVLDMKKQRASRSILTGWWHRIKMRQELNALLRHIDRYKDALARKQLTHLGPEERAENLLPSIWRRLWLHPRDRAVIVFLSLPDRLLVAVNAAGVFDFEILPVTRLRLREAVRRCFLAFAEGGSYSRKRGGFDLSDEDETVNAGEALADAASLLNLPALLGRLPASVRRLTIVPDDMLHAFPFAAVQVNGQYLGVSHAISHAYENDVVFSKPKSFGPSKKSALAVGVAKGGQRFTPLPGAEREVANVAAFFQKNNLATEVLLDEKCTRQGFFQRLAHARFLHVAAHGQFQREQPDQTGIILSDDELLSVRDILRTEAFAGVAHAAITSCWAADHFVLPGRWVISLPETMWRSGTEGILGSLWKVNDSFAVPFLEIYYENLRYHSPDVALQQARKRAVENSLTSDRQAAGPSLWAGFNFYGNPKPLRFE